MEEQGVLGTIWNKEATRLLSLFGWNTIGDYDRDVQGKDDKQYGIDALITFKTPLKNNKQIAILEAKRYETKNFNKSLLQGWIERLDKKLIELRNSENFQERFPDLSECSTLDVGIIAIWFHDTRNYYDFHSKFIFSDIVLAEARKDKITVENIVFYFGKLEIPCFRQLKSLLTFCSFLDTHKPLLLYIYQEDNEFRK